MKVVCQTHLQIVAASFVVLAQLQKMGRRVLRAACNTCLLLAKNSSGFVTANRRPLLQAAVVLLA